MYEFMKEFHRFFPLFVLFDGFTDNWVFILSFLNLCSPTWSKDRTNKSS